MSFMEAKYPVVVSGHYEIVEAGCTQIFMRFMKNEPAMKLKTRILWSVWELPELQEVRLQKGHVYWPGKPTTASMGSLAFLGQQGVYCIREQPVM